MTAYLQGKTALVVGGASGIGFATAACVVREGGNVVIGDLDGDAAVRAAEALGSRARGVKLDITLEADIDPAISLAIETFGGFDGLVNSAALPQPFCSLLDATEQDFSAIMNVNVRGTWLAMRAAIRRFQSLQLQGSIVNVSSTAGLKGSALMAIYSASKHAVIGLTRSAALEFARQGHRINAVCPGVIQTPMLQRVLDADPRVRPAFEAVQPTGRFGTAQEVGEACAWLLSPRASFSTGMILGVDGGATA